MAEKENNQKEGARKPASKSRLGGGLGALMGNNVVAPGPLNAPVGGIVKSELIKEIPLSEISPNPSQPRTKFDEEQLGELADSIRNIGIVQPITVRSMGPHSYQIIAGERRYRASLMAGLSEIPAYVREADDNQTLLLALVENVQRADLDAIEVALSYQRLMSELNLTQEEVSAKVAKSRSAVANILRLLKLPPEIQRLLRDGLIEAGHARALLVVADPEKQLALAAEIAKKGKSVREAEKMVKDANTPKPEKPAGDDGPIIGIVGNEKYDMTTVYVNVVEGIEKCFSNKDGRFNGTVNAKPVGNGGAKITIEIKEAADLMALTERLAAIG